MKSLADSPKIVLLQRNDKAPYAGALMPVEDLRKLETKSLNADLYKTELDKQLDQPPGYAPQDSSKIIIFTVLGALLGYFVGVSLR